MERRICVIESRLDAHQRGALHGAEAIQHRRYARLPGRHQVQHREQRHGAHERRRRYVVQGLRVAYPQAHPGEPGREQYADARVRHARRRKGAEQEAAALYDVGRQLKVIHSIQVAAAGLRAVLPLEDLLAPQVGRTLPVASRLR